jgi:hypothetical protein
MVDAKGASIFNMTLIKDYPWITLPLIANAPMRVIANAPLAVEVSKAGRLISELEILKVR